MGWAIFLQSSNRRTNSESLRMAESLLFVFMDVSGV